MCLDKINSITGKVSHSLSILDDQGILSQLSSSTLLKGRCGTTCFGLELESGSILGQNVLLDKKVNVIITLSTDQHLNLTTGHVDFFWPRSKISYHTRS